MIQFNLLPDIKKEYIKAKRRKRLIITVSMIASASALTVMIIMFGVVQIAEKRHINNLTKDIKKEVSSIQSIEDINEVLTVQNQLSILPALHHEKPELSRLFGYLRQLVPNEANIKRLSLDMDGKTMNIVGDADSIASIQKLVDTFKSARYSDGGNSGVVAFSDVKTQLSGDSISASFNITMSFDPVIYDNTKDIVITVGLSSGDANNNTPLSQEGN